MALLASGQNPFRRSHKRDDQSGQGAERHEESTGQPVADSSGFDFYENRGTWWSRYATKLCGWYASMYSLAARGRVPLGRDLGPILRI